MNGLQEMERPQTEESDSLRILTVERYGNIRLLIILIVLDLEYLRPVKLGIPRYSLA